MITTNCLVQGDASHALNGGHEKWGEGAVEEERHSGSPTMLRPIAENPFSDRQIAELQFAENCFAEHFICRNMYLPNFA
jgi:hypothetical protein